MLYDSDIMKYNKVVKELEVFCALAALFFEILAICGEVFAIVIRISSG